MYAEQKQSHEGPQRTQDVSILVELCYLRILRVRSIGIVEVDRVLVRCCNDNPGGGREADLFDPFRRVYPGKTEHFVPYPRKGALPVGIHCFPQPADMVRRSVTDGRPLKLSPLGEAVTVGEIREGGQHRLVLVLVRGLSNDDFEGVH